MSDRVRTFWLVLSTAFQADPLRTVSSIVIEGIGSLSFALFGVWLKLVTDGVLRDDLRAVVVGTIGLSLLPPLVTFGGGFGVRLRLTMMEKAGFAFERRYAEIAGALRGIEHHERPEFRDKLELLQQNQQLLGNAANGLVYTIVVAVQLVTTAFVVVSLHPLLLLLPLFALPSVYTSARAERLSMELEERTSPLHRQARHLFRLSSEAGAAKELRVFGLEDEIRRFHDAAWMEIHETSARLRWRLAVVRTLAFIGFALGFAAAVVFVAVRAARGQATVGDVVMAIVVAGQVNETVSTAISQYAWAKQSLRNAARFRWLLELFERESAEPPGGTPPQQLRHGITFEGVSFRYPGTDNDVLRDVDLVLPAGSVVAVVGENGAGKTTLVKLLLRLYEPTTGWVLVDGTDLGSVDHESWRRLATAGFQDFARLEFVVRESVGIGELEHVDSEPAVAGALERSGGSDVLTALPDGLSTQLGRTWDGGVELSGGQWQKLALGRALMPERPLLTVLDEPTASLDAETEHALFERYASEAHRRRADGAITILVSHRFSTVRFADMIVVLDAGRVVETGSHDELMASGGLYAELFQIQARQYRDGPSSGGDR